MGRFGLNLIKGKTSPIAATPNPEGNIEPELPKNDPILVTVTERKYLKQTLEIEIGYRDTNAWVEWVKFSVLALNKSDCYACAAGWPQAQVVPFPLKLGHRPHWDELHVSPVPGQRHLGK